MKFIRHLKLYLDRSISSARALQIGWLMGLLVIAYCVFYGINYFLVEERERIDSSRILELIVDPGVFASKLEPEEVAERLQITDEQKDSASEAVAQTTLELIPEAEDYDPRPRWLEFLIMLFGVIFFTGLMISVISNMLEGRVDAFKRGLIRYRFKDHILILGANEMLANMIRAFVADPEMSRKDIVVLTNTDVERLYARLYSELNKADLKNVTLLFGSRDSEEELVQVGAVKASRIYIIGEDEEQQHDALNISCYDKIEKLCQERKQPIDCFMVIDNLSSYHVFQYESKNDEMSRLQKIRQSIRLEQLNRGGLAAHKVLQPDENPESSVRLTIINSLENWAQQVLVTRNYGDLNYPAIDGGESIGSDSEKRVHFVVVGMTQMAVAMATNAAHIAHYPNFREGVSRTRTKISFIAPDISQEMNFFKGHYSPMFTLSRTTYVSWTDGTRNADVVEEPDPAYGDFLDVEWEFIDGGVESDEVRTLIREWCTKEEFKNDILSIAVCEKNPTANIATALYLPDEIFSSHVSVFVYQPIMGKVIRRANQTARYKNLFPFGMLHDCYDPSLRDRLLKAKRINYLYDHVYDYSYMCDDEAKLDEAWYKLTFAAKLSNLYSANSIPTKLRVLGLSDEFAPSKIVARDLTDEQVEVLARVEHNRWNVEKLLVGFRPIKKADRSKYSKEELKELKTKKFTHADIRPYADLSEGSRDYDRAIARHLFDVIKER